MTTDLRTELIFATFRVAERFDTIRKRCAVTGDLCAFWLSRSPSSALVQEVLEGRLIREPLVGASVAYVKGISAGKFGKLPVVTQQHEAMTESVRRCARMTIVGRGGSRRHAHHLD